MNLTEKNININLNEDNADILISDYLVNNNLITNSEKGNLLDELKRSLKECERFIFCVAFINYSGLQLLLDSFKDLEERGIDGQILTFTYLNFT